MTKTTKQLHMYVHHKSGKKNLNNAKLEYLIKNIIYLNKINTFYTFL